jgi:hypothetical protein
MRVVTQPKFDIGSGVYLSQKHATSYGRHFNGHIGFVVSVHSHNFFPIKGEARMQHRYEIFFPAVPPQCDFMAGSTAGKMTYDFYEELLESKT